LGPFFSTKHNMFTNVYSVRKSWKNMWFFCILVFRFFPLNVSCRVLYRTHKTQAKKKFSLKLSTCGDQKRHMKEKIHILSSISCKFLSKFFVKNENASLPIFVCYEKLSFHAILMIIKLKLILTMIKTTTCLRLITEWNWNTCKFHEQTLMSNLSCFMLQYTITNGIIEGKLTTTIITCCHHSL
jgi:hypothetical protein